MIAYSSIEVELCSVIWLNRLMKNLRTLWPFAALSVVLTACSPVKLLNTITPSGNFSKQSDVSFGDHPRFMLDVYKPKEPKLDAPVLVFVHGGGWNSGSKDLYKFIGDGFTADGYTVVVPNYRLYPNSVYPDPLTDTAKSVAWAAKAYPDRPLILMGHSAGAYNVLMMGLDKKFLAAEGVNMCERVSGIISLAGPTGIVPLEAEPYITVFPDKFTEKDAALNNVNAPAPPLFLMNGGKDDQVYPRNAIALDKKVKARSGSSDLMLYPKLSHTDAVKVLSRYFDGDSTLKGDILNFMAKNGGVKNNYCQ